MPYPWMVTFLVVRNTDSASRIIRHQSTRSTYSFKPGSFFDLIGKFLGQQCRHAYFVRTANAGEGSTKVFSTLKVAEMLPQRVADTRWGFRFLGKT